MRARPTPTPPKVEDLSQQFISIAEKVSPAVVSIDAIQMQPGHRFSDPFAPLPEGELLVAQPQRIPSVGSGLIVSADGYIVTNHHVVSGVQEVRVTLADNQVAKARWIGSDPASDLAVLKVELAGLPMVPWGESQKLRPGEFVLAFGSPFRMRGSVSHGIVSGLGRKDLGIADYEDFIQTDAAINPGNSGGPLCNLQGQVVGVNTALLSKSGGSQGIGLAIPSELARSVFEEIVAKGRVERSWLGLWIAPVTPELAQDLRLSSVHGVLVQGGYRRAPAGRAGFQAADIILDVDGKPIEDERQFRSLLAHIPVGKTVEFMVWRKGRLLKLKVKTEARAIDSKGRPARGL